MRFLLLPLLLVGAACSPVADLEEAVVPIGDFSLGFAVPRVANAVTKGPMSRDANADEWKDALKLAFETRFRRFEGEKVYHIGVSVEGYVLARIGVPLVASPKSVLIFNVFIIDDATREVLTKEPEQLTAIETLSAGSVISSGLANTKEEQLQDLAQAAAKATEKWLRQQVWFYEDRILPDDIETSNDLPEDSTVETTTEDVASDADVAVEESAAETGSETTDAVDVTETPTIDASDDTGA